MLIESQILTTSSGGSFWGGPSSREGVLPGWSFWGSSRVLLGGGSHMTYPIMHLMLPACSPDTNWSVWLDAVAYILLPQCIMGKVTWDPPRVGQTDRQTCLKTLPSRKLRMWVVIKHTLYISIEHLHELYKSKNYWTKEKYTKISMECKARCCQDSSWNLSEIFTLVQGVYIRFGSHVPEVTSLWCQKWHHVINTIGIPTKCEEFNQDL